MTIAHRVVAATVVVSLLAANLALSAESGPHFDLSLATLADDASGRSLDLNAVFTPNAHFSIAAGGGSSDAGTSVSKLHGKSFNASVDVHFGSFGVRPGYTHWNDD